MLYPRELGRLPRRSPENESGKRLQDQILSRVGEHRYKDKDREDLRLGILPDLGQRGAEGAFLGWGFIGDRGRVRLLVRLDTADDDQRHHDRNDRHGTGYRHQALGGVGIQKVPRDTCGDREADDHHEPNECRGSRLSLRCHMLCEQRKQRRTSGTGSHANGKEP